LGKFQFNFFLSFPVAYQIGSACDIIWINKWYVHNQAVIKVGEIKIGELNEEKII
jgi:hypothetical protein